MQCNPYSVQFGDLRFKESMDQLEFAIWNVRADWSGSCSFKTEAWMKIYPYNMLEMLSFWSRMGWI